jgi:diguanylate cyclase (GGDEF)-like protein
LYLYMTCGTILAFGIFGWMLGNHETSLEEISITDPLTGLRNRRYFDTRLEEEFETARRHKRPLSLLAIDLDFFKAVNDRFGHPVGDKVLALAAKRCATHVRKGETLARTGGEELGLLLPGLTASQASRVAERIRKELAGPGIVTHQGVAHITGSVGVAEISAEDRHAAHLYARADRALYRAKRGGRDRVAVEP